MAEVAPSAGRGGGSRRFLLIIGTLAVLFFVGALALGGIVLLPQLLGAQQIAAVTSTPTRISIPPTSTRTPPPTPTLVVVAQITAASTETDVPLEETATPIAITATPIMITATPDANTLVGGELPDTGVGEDMLMLVGGGLLLLGVIVVVRRMRSA